MHLLRRLPLLIALVALTAHAQTAAEWSGGSSVAEAPARSGGGPINDGLWNAEPIAGPGVYTGSNAGATNGAGRPGDADVPAECTFNGAGNDSNLSVWWYFVPTAAGEVTIDLDGSSFDTIVQVIALTSFSPGQSDVLGCNDDDPNNGAGDFTSALTIQAVPDALHMVRVTSYQTDSGDVQMSVTGSGVITGPPGDRLGSVLTETGDILALREPGLYPGTNVGATAASDEPDPTCVGAMTNSVWRFFDIDSDRTVTLDLSGSDFDTKMAVYRRDAGGVLTEVGCDDDGGTGLASRIEAVLTGGSRYYVQVAGFGGAEGRILLTYGLADPPPPTANEGAPDAALVLAAPVPNPSAGVVGLEATLASAGDVRVEVFDALGRRVAVVADGPAPAGPSTWTWDASAQPAGVYAVRLVGASGSVTRTVTIGR